MSAHPLREIRAVFDRDTVVVYQAYCDEIADAALNAQRFVAPFSFGRMTWVKPSFLWMMERSGWATKSGQERVLAVRITREGFEQALSEAVLTHSDPKAAEARVQVQWDPERDIRGTKLGYQSLQVGLGRGIVRAYVEEWIRAIEDVTPLAHRMKKLLREGDAAAAEALLPSEKPYPAPEAIRRRLGMSPGESA